MTNNYFIVNPKVGDFIRRQKNTNVLLVCGVAIGGLLIMNRLITLENKVARLENRVEECEAEN